MQKHIDTAKQLAIMELALGVPNVVGYTQDGRALAAATSATFPRRPRSMAYFRR